jgi:alpha-tubulin suppressor-like RCC1 family protein
MAQTWSFVGVGSAVFNSPTLTVPVPSGYTQGDTLILVGEGPYAWVTPDGWTNIILNAGQRNQSVWFKYAEASEPPCYITPTSPGGQNAAVMLCYRGIYPYKIRSSNVNGGSISSITTSTTTTSNADSLVLSIFGCIAGSFTWTAGAGYTQRAILNPSGSNAGFFVGEENQAAVGTTTARSITMSGSTQLDSVQVVFSPGVVPNYYFATQYQPYTGFNTTDPNTGNLQDLGSRYTTKSYLLDVYPNIASQLGTRTAPGLWGWGDNSSGQLGQANITNYSSPVQVGSLTNWQQIAGDSHSLAIKTDGTLWAWGSNSNGQIGNNTITNYSSPIQVGSPTIWKQVAAGSFSGHSLGISTSGRLYVWGSNGAGQIGTNVPPGVTFAYSSPVQIGALTNWKLVAGGHSASWAIKTDGTIWAWGRNVEGQLGQGNITYRSSPIQIGSLTNWKSITSTSSAFGMSAIKTDSTLWTWGINDYGQLGLGDIVSRSSPVQVGALVNWRQVATGRYHTLAVKTDGTLWAWGRNEGGQLGLGNVILYSSPVQVGSLTNWKSARAIGQNNALALKTDGTIWAWGLNSTGQLGNSNIIGYSSPIQIGLLSTWKSISCGYNSVFSIADGYI